MLAKRYFYAGTEAFQKGLLPMVPVIIVDGKNKKFLMQAWMNVESFEKTCEKNEAGNRFVWLYVPARNEAYLRGGSSGNKLQVIRIFIDRTHGTVLIHVKALKKINEHHQWEEVKIN